MNRLLMRNDFTELYGYYHPKLAYIFTFPLSEEAVLNMSTFKIEVASILLPIDFQNILMNSTMTLL